MGVIFCNIVRGRTRNWYVIDWNNLNINVCWNNISTITYIVLARRYVEVSFGAKRMFSSAIIREHIICAFVLTQIQQEKVVCHRDIRCTSE